MTKHLISEAGGVRTYLALTPLQTASHQGWSHIKISSTYDFARDPAHEQTKLDLCLSAQDLANLKAAINEM
jgi:hypothetical protein